MMNQRHIFSLLLAASPILVLAACNGGGPDAAPPQANQAEVQPTATPTPTPSISPVSIIRPAVQAEVEEEAPPPAPKPVERTIGFTTGALLDDTGRKAIDALLAEVNRPGRFVVRGHSDSRGYDGDNLVASRRRAEAVRDYLVEKGVAADRIRVIAMGEGQPIVPNVRPDGSDDEAGRMRNRRAEITYTPAEAEAQPDAADPKKKLTIIDPK
jgi:OmpA-OmpF porin, OOP family